MEFGPRGVCTSSDAFPMREAGVEFTDQIRNCLFHDGHLLFAFLYCPFPQDTCSLTQSHKNIKYILCEEWYTFFVCLTLCELRSETAGILCVFQEKVTRSGRKFSGRRRSGFVRCCTRPNYCDVYTKAKEKRPSMLANRFFFVYTFHILPERGGLYGSSCITLFHRRC